MLKNEDRRFGPGEYLIALIFAGIIVVVSVQVFCRYILNSSLGWAEELCTYLFVWLVFLGVALAVKDRTHIRVDILLCRFPYRVRQQVEVFNNVVVLVFTVAMVWLGFRMVVVMSGALSPALNFPVNYATYAALPITSLFGIFYATRGIIRTLHSCKCQAARGEKCPQPQKEA